MCTNGASQVSNVVKNSPANAGGAGDAGSIPVVGRFLRGGHGNPLQYAFLENPMDRGACWAAAHRVLKIQMHISTHVCKNMYRYLKLNIEYKKNTVEK